MGQAITQGNERGVMLDTSVCIEILRRNPDIIEIFNVYSATPLISSVTVYELLLRKSNIEKATAFIQDTKVVDFDSETAEKASEITKQLDTDGTPVESRDVFIAATAIVNGCALATLNIKDFSRIKGLKLIKI